MSESRGHRGRGSGVVTGHDHESRRARRPPRYGRVRFHPRPPPATPGPSTSRPLRGATPGVGADVGKHREAAGLHGDRLGVGQQLSARQVQGGQLVGGDTQARRGPARPRGSTCPTQTRPGGGRRCHLSRRHHCGTAGGRPPRLRCAAVHVPDDPSQRVTPASCRRATTSASRVTSTVLPGAADTVSEYQWSDGGSSTPSRSPARTACSRWPTQPRRLCAPRSGTTAHSGWGCDTPTCALDPIDQAGAPEPLRRRRPRADGQDVRLAQWCMAHPPASSAAPTSASRWRLRPVKAREPEGVAAAEVRPVGIFFFFFWPRRNHRPQTWRPTRSPPAGAYEGGTGGRLSGQDLRHHPGRRP